MEATDLRVIADHAEQTAKYIRKQSGRTRGRMLGPDSVDEKAIEDLAGSWIFFARRLQSEAKKIEKTKVDTGNTDG